MPIRTEWINRLRYAGRRTRFEDEFDDEIRFHLETRAAEIEQTGLSHNDALAQARREFGSVTRSREESRSAWQFVWLQDLAADLRYAFRAFGRSPGFTATAVLSLALGIGANSAIFTALDTVMWRDLPVADPASLVKLSVLRENNVGPFDLPAEFVRQVQESGIFSDVITRPNADGLSFTYDDRAERIIGEAVSPNYFTALGSSRPWDSPSRPAYGRGPGRRKQ